MRLRHDQPGLAVFINQAGLGGEWVVNVAVMIPGDELQSTATCSPEEARQIAALIIRQAERADERNRALRSGVSHG